MGKFSCELKLSLNCRQKVFYLQFLNGFIIATAFFTLLITVSGQTLPRDQIYSQLGFNAPFTPLNPRLFRPNNFPRNNEITNNRILPQSGILNSPTTGGLDPSFNPTLQTYPGYANASAVQADGKIIIGGYFNVINGLSKRNLVRFNVDGMLDATFNVDINSSVTAVAIQSDGKIVIGGYFGSVNNIDRFTLARLNSDGSLDTSFFNLTYASAPIDLAIQPDGKIIIVGYSSEIIRLNSDGSLDTSFTASVNNGLVQAVALQPNGKVIIGGFFSSVNNTSLMSGLALLNTDGSLDTAFNPNIGTSSFVNDVALQTDGKIVISGNFLINGNQFNGVVRLNSNGSLDNSFNTDGGGADSQVNSIAISPNGKIIASGYFSVYNGENRTRIVQLNSNGTLDMAFNGGFNVDATINTVNYFPDNKIFAGGFFTSYNGVSRDTGIRLNSNGTIDSSLALTSLSPADIETSLTQPDGKILIAGYFNRVNGTNSSKNIIRLNTDGTIDSSFNVGSGANYTIYAMTLQPDGKIIVGGYFDSINGTTRNEIARLNPDGSLDSSFNPAINRGGVVLSLSLQPDGKIVVGGYISVNIGTNSSKIVRLNADGSADSSFNSNIEVNNQINRVALQPDGKILFGGYFTQVNGNNYYGIARLNANGSIDTSFNSPAIQNTLVWAIALQSDGKILIGGQIFIGDSFGGITRLNANGSLDTSFENVSAFIGSITDDIALQASGKILIVGSIFEINGVTRHNLARLNPDGSLDLGFNVLADDYVRDISLTDNGQKAIIGGYFTNIDGVPRAGLARIFLETSPNARTPFDFDGDGRTDYGVFRPSNAVWYLARSTQGFYATQFGLNTDKLAPADYDGDGKTDVSVFRDGTWYILQSSNNQVRINNFGQTGDAPVPADYDGDGKADLGVFRQGVWYFLNSSNNQFRAVQFGVATDKPVQADYDGDGKTDIAVYRDGAWYYLQSSDSSYRVVNFGIATDKVVPADYDGDGKADQAVYRNGTWYLNRSTQGIAILQFGFASDIPVTGDYDGDGKADIAVWRPANGTFYSIKSSSNQFVSFQWGANGDFPIATTYAP